MGQPTTDTKKKKELVSRQQDNSTTTVTGTTTTTTTTAIDYFSSRNNQVEAVAVQVPVGPDGRSMAQQTPGLVVVHEHVVVNHPGRDYRRAECFYTIAIEDPVEMVHARNMAISHIVFEVLGVFISNCTSDRCIVIVVLAVASSSAVACCFRQRASYSAWTLVALLLIILHFLTATDALRLTDFEAGQGIIGLVHLFLTVVCIVIVCIGLKTVSATGGGGVLQHWQTGVPMQGSSNVGQGMQPSQIDSHA